MPIAQAQGHADYCFIDADSLRCCYAAYADAFLLLLRCAAVATPLASATPLMPLMPLSMMMLRRLMLRFRAA